MTNLHPQDREEIVGGQESKGRSEILHAIIEHSSRPVAYVLIGLFATIWLFSIKDVIKTARFGDFEVEIQSIAKSADVSRELNALSKLSDGQLQLFLIIGRKRTHITYYGEELNEENLEALEAAGLLTEYRVEVDGSFWWRVSTNGHRLHNVIFNLIVSEIRRSAT
jgi:hypothetical protein